VAGQPGSGRAHSRARAVVISCVQGQMRYLAAATGPRAAAELDGPGVGPSACAPAGGRQLGAPFFDDKLKAASDTSPPRHRHRDSPARPQSVFGGGWPASAVPSVNQCVPGTAKKEGGTTTPPGPATSRPRTPTIESGRSHCPRQHGSPRKIGSMVRLVSGCLSTACLLPVYCLSTACLRRHHGSVETVVHGPR
jgi:hypothetical protein